MASLGLFPIPSEHIVEDLCLTASLWRLHNSGEKVSMIQQENMYEICIISPVENDTKNIFFTTKQQQESLAISLQVMH